MISNPAHKKLYAISFAALILSLLGNTVSWVERGRIEDVARKTNEGLICTLQRAEAQVRLNLSGRSEGEIAEAVAFYKREIDLLGGRRDCAPIEPPR